MSFGNPDRFEAVLVSELCGPEDQIVFVVAELGPVIAEIIEAEFNRSLFVGDGQSSHGKSAKCVRWAQIWAH